MRRIDAFVSEWSVLLVCVCGPVAVSLARNPAAQVGLVVAGVLWLLASAWFHDPSLGRTGAPGWLEDSAADLAAKMGIGAPAVAVDSRLTSVASVEGFGSRRCIVVHPSLLRSRLPARAVVAHEMAHVKLHGFWQSSATALSSMLPSLIVAAPWPPTVAVAVAVVVGVVASLAALAWSRRSEMVADAVAVRTEPVLAHALADIVVRTGARDAASGVVRQLLATHPDDELRAAAIRAAAQPVTAGTT
jgi:Zn-dependent protease with chaperone function